MSSIFEAGEKHFIKHTKAEPKIDHAYKKKSITEIQYFQIEPNQKRTNTNDSMMLKHFISRDSSDKQNINHITIVF